MDSSISAHSVRWDKEARKWRASIRYYGNQIHLGFFEYRKDAIIARRNAKVQYFGVFADIVDC